MDFPCFRPSEWLKWAVVVGSDVDVNAQRPTCRHSKCLSHRCGRCFVRVQCGLGWGVGCLEIRKEGGPGRLWLARISRNCAVWLATGVRYYRNRNERLATAFVIRASHEADTKQTRTSTNQTRTRHEPRLKTRHAPNTNPTRTQTLTRHEPGHEPDTNRTRTQTRTRCEPRH